MRSDEVGEGFWVRKLSSGLILDHRNPAEYVARCGE